MQETSGCRTRGLRHQVGVWGSEVGGVRRGEGGHGHGHREERVWSDGHHAHAQIGAGGLHGELCGYRAACEGDVDRGRHLKVKRKGWGVGHGIWSLLCRGGR